MKPHWFTVAALTIIVLVLALTPPFIASPPQYAALLERLAPRIERAHALPPETRETLLQLIEKARQMPADGRTDARRQLAIERVAKALKARELDLGNVGLRQD
jgi:hypothetical protein